MLPIAAVSVLCAEVPTADGRTATRLMEECCLRDSALCVQVPSSDGRIATASNRTDWTDAGGRQCKYGTGLNHEEPTATRASMAAQIMPKCKMLRDVPLGH